MSLNPLKLENVAEWLNKSFDQTKNKTYLQAGPTCINRRNSEEPSLQINDEPLVEISLNNDFYAQKNHQQQRAASLVPESSYYAALQKICIYKDPKEMEAQAKKSACKKPCAPGSRRTSSELGINISGCQNIPDLSNEGSLAALVTRIEPDGVIQKFKVEIDEGDEIVEINGYNLRNKNDEQIDEIFNTSCHSNNGEIELLVRRRSSVSSAQDFNSDLHSNHEREMIKKANQANESSNEINVIYTLILRAR